MIILKLIIKKLIIMMMIIIILKLMIIIIKRIIIIIIEVVVLVLVSVYENEVFFVEFVISKWIKDEEFNMWVMFLWLGGVFVVKFG